MRFAGRCEARARRLRIRFVEADLRTLQTATRDTFDVVICCDNSLAHMMTSHDLARATQGIAARLKPSGFFIASIRDYDELTETHPVFTPPVRFRDPAPHALSFSIGIGSATAGLTISISSSLPVAVINGRCATISAAFARSCAVSSPNDSETPA